MYTYLRQASFRDAEKQAYASLQRRGVQTKPIKAQSRLREQENDQNRTRIIAAKTIECMKKLGMELSNAFSIEL